VGWKDVLVPRPYPREFRDDVVRVACNRGDGVTIEQIATDFGVHPMTLHKWMRQADIDEGAKPGRSTGESAELREARRRIKLLEQENEVLRRATACLSPANLPGKGSPRSGKSSPPTGSRCHSPG
jgi:transposase